MYVYIHASLLRFYFNFKAPAVTQAVAVIDRQGTLNTDNGPINYHIEGVVSFTRVSDQLTKITGESFCDLTNPTEQILDHPETAIGLVMPTT